MLTRLRSKPRSQGCGFTLSTTRLGQKEAHHQCAPSPPGPVAVQGRRARGWLRELEEKDGRERHTPNGWVGSNTPLSAARPTSNLQEGKNGDPGKIPNLKCLHTTPGSRESSQPLPRELQGLGWGTAGARALAFSFSFPRTLGSTGQHTGFGWNSVDNAVSKCQPLTFHLP